MGCLVCVIVPSVQPLDETTSVGRPAPTVEGIEAILKEVLSAEQICFVGTRFDDPQQPPAHLQRLRRFLPALERVIRRQGFLQTLPPTDWNGKDWTDAARWLHVLDSTASSLHPSSTERLVKAIYARAVIELATLLPAASTPDLESTYSRKHGIFYSVYLNQEKIPSNEKVFFDAVARDRLRALWELRYFNVSKGLMAKVSSPCIRQILADGVARRCFVDEVDSSGERLSRRRALGWAYGMCGRSMNAHFVDELIDAGLRPEPIEWSGRLSNKTLLTVKE
jgi:hypothetical protein